jgi:hypothetical protein
MTTSLSPAAWFAFVRSDVYLGSPNNEDGEAKEEIAFYVVCENPRGVRYASRKAFTSERLGREASSVAEAFCKKVTAGLASGADPAKSPKWAPIQGCYGSAAWSEEDELDLEARALEVEAGVGEADRFRRVVGIGA